jgi:hypothetical protein
MPYWNHRIVQKRDPLFDETYFEVHEAHYNDDDELALITVEPITPYGMDIEQLKDTLENMRHACDKPILIEGEIEFAPYDDEDGNPEV